MPFYLRQSTASQEIPLGVFVDETDGFTAEAALTINNTDIRIWKTGATTLANKNSGGATNITGGRYYAVLDATDTDTIGPMEITVHVAGARPVKVECCVLDEVVYDVMFGTSAPLVAGTNAATTSFSNGLNITGGTNGDALVLLATTSGHGFKTTGVGSAKHGILATGGTNASGVSFVGAGTGHGMLLTAGATGTGMSIIGGGTSGNGINITTTSGHGINIAPVGTDMHGILSTGGNGGTSDGVKLAAGTGGVGLRVGSLTSTGAVTVDSLAITNALTAATITVSGTTTLANFQANAVSFTSFTPNFVTDAIGSGQIAASAITEIQSGLATSAEIAALNDLSAAEVNAEVVDVIRTDIIPDSIPADGTRPTLAQAAYMVLQFLVEASISGTTVTVKKVDGSTTLFTCSTNSATAPTNITRAS